MADEEQQCVFCHIANGKIPAKKVYEDKKVTAVLDINPASPGHILLLTKEHASIMPQMSEEIVAHIGMVAKQLSYSLFRGLKVDGTSIFVANGVAAGQRAPHFMLHIIPRTVDDGINLQPPAKKIDDNTVKEVFEKLSGAVAKQFGVAPPKAEEKKEEAKEEEKAEEKEEEKKEEPKEEEIEEDSEQAKLDDIADLLTGDKK